MAKDRLSYRPDLDSFVTDRLPDSENISSLRQKNAEISGLTSDGSRNHDNVTLYISRVVLGCCRLWL